MYKYNNTYIKKGLPRLITIEDKLIRHIAKYNRQIKLYKELEKRNIDFHETTEVELYIYSEFYTIDKAISSLYERLDRIKYIENKLKEHNIDIINYYNFFTKYFNKNDPNVERLLSFIYDINFLIIHFNFIFTDFTDIEKKIQNCLFIWIKQNNNLNIQNYVNSLSIDNYPRILSIINTIINDKNFSNKCICDNLISVKCLMKLCGKCCTDTKCNNHTNKNKIKLEQISIN